MMGTMTIPNMDPTTINLQPIPLTVTRYICPFCHRGRSRARACLEHMARCWKNPALKGCKTCINFLGHDKCGVGFNLKNGLVTKCQKWKPAAGESSA